MIRKILVFIGVASFSAGLSACGVGEAKVSDEMVAETAQALPVETSLPFRDSIYATYQTTSTLESDADAPIIARVPGDVVEILVEEGDTVRSGQVLARLDGDRMRFELQQARANLEKVTREYERLLSLHERGLVSEAMFDGLKFDIEAMQASYELKKLNYGYTEIRAPIAGVVSSRDIKVGRQVDVGQTVFRVTDSSRLVARLKIPQSELPKFEAGHALVLSVDAMPDIMYAANIERISPTIDVATGTFRATAYVDNKSGDLAAGMFARFSVAYETHDNALLITDDAVIREDNISVVYVVRNGAAERRIIETGIESGGLVEVLSGLSVSDIVITTGKTTLSDGSRVLARSAVALNTG